MSKLLTTVLLALILAGFTGPIARADKDLSVVPTHGALAQKAVYDQSYALLVGVNHYPKLPGQLQLHFAVADAMAMRDILIKYYGFPASHVRMLLDGDATKQNIDDALSDFADRRKYHTDDRVLVFFSGHGQTVSLPGGGEMGFLIPNNADVDLADIDNAGPFLRSCVEMEEVWDYLQSTPAKHVLLVADACYSGLLTQTRALGIAPGALSAMAAKRALQVMTAGGKGETSTELDRYGHGAFTYKLLDELTSRAAAGPGNVFTSSELYGAVERSVTNLTNGAQDPQFGNYKTEGNFLFITTKPQTVPSIASVVDKTPTPTPSVNGRKSHTTSGKATVNVKPQPHETQGGANQVQGLEANLGQMLFDGNWRFQVLAVQSSDSYTLKVPATAPDYAKYNGGAEFDPDTYIFTPKQGNTFISVDCLAKNGQNSMQQLDFYSDQQNTAITDDQENAYTPIAFDMVASSPWTTRNLLPGSGEKLTILFAVPKGTNPQDLVVTLKNWNDHKGKDIRVHLKP